MYRLCRPLLWISFILPTYFLQSCRQHKSAPSPSAGVQKTRHAPQVKPTAVRGNSEFARKMQLSQKEIKNNKLYRFSQEWYGVPYRYGGCTKAGVDCSCFANILYLDVYRRQLSRSAQEMFVDSKKVSIEDAAQGDLVFFKIGGKTVSHVGVLLKNRYFIHASSSSGVVVNHLDEVYYKKFFFCAGKMKGV